MSSSLISFVPGLGLLYRLDLLIIAFARAVMCSAASSVFLDISERLCSNLVVLLIFLSLPNWSMRLICDDIPAGLPILMEIN